MRSLLELFKRENENPHAGKRLPMGIVPPVERYSSKSREEIDADMDRCLHVPWYTRVFGIKFGP